MKGGNGMQNKYEINSKIDSYIERLSNSGIIKSFYPNAITKALDIPLTPTLERLNRLVEDEVLELKFEIRCHEGSHVIDILNDYSKYLDKEVYCIYCGEYVYIDMSNISPIYYIREEYKEYLKKKNKMNIERHKEIYLKELPITV